MVNFGFIFGVIVMLFVARYAESLSWEVIKCGEGLCGIGQYCYTDPDNSSHCLLTSELDQLEIKQSLEKTWIEKNKQFSLYRVAIINIGDEKITHVVLGIDYTLNLRDNTSMWNIKYDDLYGYLSLPEHVKYISPNSSHIFGYIVKGHTSPNMVIRSVSCK
ncbi:hypothetical protein CYY_005136 [Polysphondylium violaceum]|uniref:Carbohydrate binding domain-containing protein n=1 Tax=Polysphondylium violaceum TaxID=133409 RepID=A0A8J4PU93_9MYCE|nr:hypothetical protein CYY_005136 [Polysphondylium violaceum]